MRFDSGQFLSGFFFWYIDHSLSCYMYFLSLFSNRDMPSPFAPANEEIAYMHTCDESGRWGRNTNRKHMKSVQ